MSEMSQKTMGKLIEDSLKSGDLKVIKKPKSNRRTYRRKQWRKKNEKL